MPKCEVIYARALSLAAVEPPICGLEKLFRSSPAAEATDDPLLHPGLLAPARSEGRRLPIGPKNPRENNMAFLRASDMGFLAYQSANPSA